MSYGFKFLLVQANGDPFDPSVLVSAAPNHDVGDPNHIRRRRSGARLAVEQEIAPELVERGFLGVLTVEPIDE